jgi:hypothetical protein
LIKLEEEDEQEEEEQALEAYKSLVPLKYETFEDYQKDIDRVWDSMGHLPDSFCFPVHHCGKMDI